MMERGQTGGTPSSGKEKTDGRAGDGLNRDERYLGAKKWHDPRVRVRPVYRLVKVGKVRREWSPEPVELWTVEDRRGFAMRKIVQESTIGRAGRMEKYWEPKRHGYPTVRNHAAALMGSLEREAELEWGSTEA